MVIAVDAMGGDYAPDVVIEGVVQALKENKELSKIVLVGDTERISALMASHGLKDHPKVEMVHASQVVEMHEPSTLAIRGKKDSSITVCANLAKEGKVEAIVSAGHTGAAVAASVIKMRNLEGVDRPCIATMFPAPERHFVIVDAGATPDCTPENLVQFAIMGDIYAKSILKRSNPVVGLLSNGEEESKGNELTKETLKLLKEVPSINFVGNVEGSDVFEGKVDVVVCDGFTGNVVLKFGESLATGMFKMLKNKLETNPKRKVGALLAKNAFMEVKSVADKAEYGGAPLMGVNGVCIIGHGSSCSKAIKNAIKVAGEFVKNGVNQEIVDRIKELENK
ncbi:MAG: phosphate acyltransferase PlsX [Lentisphaeraceae bacterium]|nr:phosphate acyltransferase PlsX [Lentisphaeraceae bacterium]